MQGIEGFLFGILGGALVELVGLFKLRREMPPQYLKSKFYWVVTSLMSLADGILVVIYLRSGMTLNPLLAVNIGASTPLILGSFVSVGFPPTIRPDKVN